MLSRDRFREGIIAGLIGAAVVATWFFLVDMMADRPFFTPAVLGSALFDIIGVGPDARGFWMHVAGYSVVHGAGFILLGMLVASLLETAERRPSVATGLIVLFVVFEVAFYAWMAVLSRSPLFGRIAWYQFGAANLIAAFAMGRYLWRAHHPDPNERWLRAIGAKS